MDSSRFVCLKLGGKRKNWRGWNGMGGGFDQTTFSEWGFVCFFVLVLILTAKWHYARISSVLCYKGNIIVTTRIVDF